MGLWRLRESPCPSRPGLLKPRRAAVRPPALPADLTFPPRPFVNTAGYPGQGSGLPERETFSEQGEEPSRPQPPSHHPPTSHLRTSVARGKRGPAAQSPTAASSRDIPRRHGSRDQQTRVYHVPGSQNLQGARTLEPGCGVYPATGSRDIPRRQGLQGARTPEAGSTQQETHESYPAHGPLHPPRSKPRELRPP